MTETEIADHWLVWQARHPGLPPDRQVVAFVYYELAQQAYDYEVVLQDKRRLTRELDVAMNGEEGAAKQAAMIDLIGPAAHQRAWRERACRYLARLIGHYESIPIDIDMAEAKQLYGDHYGRP